jgi:flagellar biosynthetic protein FlhB
MAENQDGQEKTEQPTAKRLEDARRKGQVPRSRELNAMAVTLLGVVSLVAMSRSLGNSLSQMMSGRFVLTREEIFDVNSMLANLGQGVAEAFLGLSPFFSWSWSRPSSAPSPWAASPSAARRSPPSWRNSAPSGA